MGASGAFYTKTDLYKTCKRHKIELFQSRVYTLFNVPL